jgi:hypothetical protein
MPGEVGGEHAQQNVRCDSVGEMVAHWPEVWVIGCDGAKVSFDVGEVLVGAYHVNGA